MTSAVEPVTPRTHLDIRAIERANLQPSTKKKYTRAIIDMNKAGVNPFDDNDGLQEYAATLKSSRKQFLKSALRLCTLNLANGIKSHATPQNIDSVHASLFRLEAMNAAVPYEKPQGTKAHTWLSGAQVKRMTAACDDTTEGKRDYIVLALQLGAGLRREEVSTLQFSGMKEQQSKTGTRWVLEVNGKGDKTRVIPISNTLADRLIAWREIVGDGYIVRSFMVENKGEGKVIGNNLSAGSIFKIVRKYGAVIKKELAPHDLRRTYAQLGFDNGVPITQISVLLGHSSVATTQKYLNLALDLESTASDFVPLAA